MWYLLSPLTGSTLALYSLEPFQNKRSVHTQQYTLSTCTKYTHSSTYSVHRQQYTPNTYTQYTHPVHLYTVPVHRYSWYCERATEVQRTHGLSLSLLSHPTGNQACRNPGMLKARIPTSCDICRQFWSYLQTNHAFLQTNLSSEQNL